MKNVESWAKSIREFILERVIDARAEKLHERSEDDDDFTDALLRSLSKEDHVTKNTIIFMLEDFLGGHSAIGKIDTTIIFSVFNNNFFRQAISFILRSATSQHIPSSAKRFKMKSRK